MTLILHRPSSGSGSGRHRGRHRLTFDEGVPVSRVTGRPTSVPPTDPLDLAPFLRLLPVWGGADSHTESHLNGCKLRGRDGVYIGCTWNGHRNPDGRNAR